MSKTRAPQPAAKKPGGDPAALDARKADRELRGNQYVAWMLEQRRSGIREEDEGRVDELETLAIGQAQLVDNVADTAWEAVPAIDGFDDKRFAKKRDEAVATAAVHDEDVEHLRAGIEEMRANPESGAAAGTLNDYYAHARDVRNRGASLEVMTALGTRSVHGVAADGGPGQVLRTGGPAFADEVAGMFDPVAALLASAEHIYTTTLGAAQATGDEAEDVAAGLSEHFDGLDVTGGDAGYLWLVFAQAGPSRSVWTQLHYLLGLDDAEVDAPAELKRQWEADEASAQMSEEAAFSDGMGGFTDGERSYATLDEAKAAKAAKDAEAAASVSAPDPAAPDQVAPSATASGAPEKGSRGWFGWLLDTWQAATTPTVAPAPGPAYVQGQDATGGRGAQLGTNVPAVDPKKASGAQRASKDVVDRDVQGRNVMERRKAQELEDEGNDVGAASIRKGSGKPDPKDQIHTEKKASGTVLVEQGKVTGTGGYTVTKEDGHGNVKSGGGSVTGAVDDMGNVTGGAAGQYVRGDEKDQKGWGGEASVSTAPNGVIVKGGASRIGKTDGTDFKQSGSATIDTDKRRLTLEGGATTGKFHKEKGGSGSLTYGLDDNWNINYFEMGGKYKTGKGGSVGGKVSMGHDVGKPTKVGDQWAVDVSDTESLSGTAGYDKGLGGPSDKVGGSATLKGLTKTGGRRVFKTQAEAEEFRKKAQAGEVTTAMPGSAEDALALKEGENALRSDMTGVDVEAHGSYGVVSAGVSASGAGIDDVKVTRGSGKTVFVERAHTSMGSGSASVGAGGVGLSKGGGSGDMSAKKVAFDLATPAGRMAYERYVKDGTLLPMPNAWRQVSEETATMDSSSWGVSAPGVSFNESHEVVDGKRTGDDGKVEYSVGTDKTGLRIVGWGHANASHGMEIVEVDDKERYYTARTSLDNSERDDDAKALGRATGGYWGHTSDGYFNGEDSRGKWNVTSVFTEDEVMGGVGRAAKDGRMGDASEYRTWSKLPPNLRDGPNGQDEMAGAMQGDKPDMDLFRKGMARWVADDGLDAIEKTRHLAGFDDYRSTGGHGKDEGQRYYLELEGDPWWTGFTGWKLAERQAGDLERRAGDNAEDKQAVLTEIGTLTQFFRDKMEKVAEYEEVPIHLVRQEQIRCRDMMDRLEKAAATARATPTTVEDDAAQQSVMLPSTAQQDPRFQRIQRVQGQLADARDSARAALGEANHHHGIHHTAQLPLGGGTPRKRLPNEEAAYREADADFDKGKQLVRDAQTVETLFEAASRDASGAGNALAYLVRARSLYQRATPLLRKSAEAYHAIAWRNTAGGLAPWWDDLERHFDAPLDL